MEVIVIHLISVLIFTLGGCNPTPPEVYFQSILSELDLPRPWLGKKAYMELAYNQAKKAGATPEEMARMRRKAHEESRGNPRICVAAGCGPFGQRIRPLAEQYVNTLATRNTIRWLLTNKPGYSARIALDMIRRCERLAGKENWHCCYGGAYRPHCRIKWDRKYREEQEKKKKPNVVPPENIIIEKILPA